MNCENHYGSNCPNCRPINPPTGGSSVISTKSELERRINNHIAVLDYHIVDRIKQYPGGVVGEIGAQLLIAKSQALHAMAVLFK
jgi:hypothetical protein